RQLRGDLGLLWGHECGKNRPFGWTDIKSHATSTVTKAVLLLAVFRKGNQNGAEFPSGLRVVVNIGGVENSSNPANSCKEHSRLPKFLEPSVCRLASCRESDGDRDCRTEGAYAD